MDPVEEATLPDSPSLPEVVRRLDDVTKSVERLIRTLEQSYVRRDVYDARHDALRSSVNGQIRDSRDLFTMQTTALDASLRGQIAGLREDIIEIKDARKADLAFRRQVLGGLAVGLILLLITSAISLSNFMARGGFG